MKDKIKFQLEEFELGGIDVFELIKSIKEILKESNKRENVDSNDQINCYCGHTTICDCQPLNAIEKAENDFIKSKIEEGEKSGFAELDVEFLKEEDTKFDTLADAHAEERMNIIGQNGNDGLHYGNE